MRDSVRKQLPGKEKIRLLKTHFLEKKTISELCESANVTPASFYLWQRELFDKGEVVFDTKRKGKMATAATAATERTIAALTAKLAEKNEVIAELMQETLKLKKLDGVI